MCSEALPLRSGDERSRPSASSGLRLCVQPPCQASPRPETAVARNPQNREGPCTGQSARRRSRSAGFLLLLGLAGGMLGLPRIAPAQNNGGQDDLSPSPETLRTEDGWPIHITYFPSPEEKKAPVVVLLHGQGDDRLVWRQGPKRGLAERLQDHGYFVITVDLRKHGESRPPGQRRDAENLRPGDYRAMVNRDLEAVKKFIYEQHQQKKLNMRKMAIVAAEESAPIAVQYALMDWLKKPWPDAPTFAARTPRGQDVRALVLLSPKEAVPGILAARALRQLRNPAWGVSFLVMYGSRNNRDVEKAANNVYKIVSGPPANADRTYLQPFDVPLQGTDLLGQSQLEGRPEAYILSFLDEHLKQLPDPWEDRESPLN